MKSALLAFVAGTLFAAGLALSGMIAPANVIAFLDVGGRWDPSLALVMVGAIGVHAAAIAWTRRRGRTLDGAALDGAAKKGIDKRLVVGAVLFGVGWGLGGFCPGPALVSAAAGAPAALVFVVGMSLGMIAERQFAATSTGSGPATSSSSHSAIPRAPSIE